MDTLDWTEYEELSSRWRQEGREFAQAVNRYVHIVLTEGWEVAGELAATDSRGDMAEEVLSVVRAANEHGELDKLRTYFPPAWDPLVERIKAQGQAISSALLLDGNRYVIRAGAPYEAGKVYLLLGERIEPVPDVITFGRSPDRRYIAKAYETGVDIHTRWDGPEHVTLPWPTGREGVLGEYDASSLEGTPSITQISPFPDGKRALLVSPDSIFVLAESGAKHIHPDRDAIVEYIEWLREEYPDDEPLFDIDMEHGAISPDGQLIAVGDQSSKHRVLNSGFEEVASVGHLSEYPHYAVFSANGQHVALNSCHFYNGCTIGVHISELDGLNSEPYEIEPPIVLLDDDARVYAATAREDEFIVGDAYGYVRAFSVTGEKRWQHFVGSTISSIDISADGRVLLVGTYAGMVHLIDLDTPEADPYQIGTATHRELRRWIFWRGERPVIW